MTTPFWCLAIGCLLPYVWSTVAGVARARQFGTIDNKYPREQSAKLEGSGARAYAASLNAFEALPLFASGVLVASIADASATTSANLALVWVTARILHGVFYLANLDILRTLIFFVGLLSALGLFWAAS